MSSGYGYGYHHQQHAHPQAQTQAQQYASSSQNVGGAASAYANPHPPHAGTGTATNGAYAQYYHQRQQAYQQRLAAYYDEQRRTADFQARMQQSYKQVHPVPPNLYAQTAPQIRSYANVAGAPAAPHAYPSASYARSYGVTPAPVQQPVATPAKPVAPKAPAPKPAAKPTGFPDSLQAYVQSALKQCINDKVKKKETEEMLKVIVEKAISGNTMWTTDWAKEPAPAVLYAKITGKPLQTADTVPSRPNSSSATTGKSESSKPAGMGYAVDVARGAQSVYSNPGTVSNSSSSVVGRQPQYTHPSYASQGQVAYQAPQSNVHPSYKSNSGVASAAYPAQHHSTEERSSYSDRRDEGRVERSYREAGGYDNAPELRHEQHKRKSSAKAAGKTKKAKRDKSKSKVKEQIPKKKSMAGAVKLNSAEKSKRSQRQERFSKVNASRKMDTTARWNPYQAQIDAARIKSAIRTAEEGGKSLDLSKFAIKGTCKDLEKRYLRLTSAPDPSTVRPEDVLIDALKWVKKRWRKRKKYSSQSEMESKTPYVWASEQLKAIRQDLTVQHIQNSFTVNVYETHAKLALEQEDLTEFNQCQTKLVELYNRNLGDVERKNEFAAYRIFYQIYIRFKYSSPSSEMTTLLASLSPEQRQSKVVKHALKVRSAVEDRNYAAFFFLYETVENMGVFLLDLLLDYVRHTALQVICRAYRPTIPLGSLQRMLLLEPGSKEWTDLFINPKVVFLDKVGKPVSSFRPDEANKVYLDTKASSARFNASFQWRVLKGDNVQRSET